jgi:hypothetical protein
VAIDALFVTLFLVLADKSLSEALAPPLFDSSILLVVWWTFLVLSYHLLISTVFLAVNSFEEQHPTAIVADY